MITEMVVRNAKPRDTSYKIADAQALYLYVTPSGFRSWRYNYRFAGKSKTLVLGDYPTLSLKLAREKRDQAREALRGGRDPGIMKKLGVYKVGGERSFEAVARKWHDASKRRWRERHVDDVLRSLERDIFPLIGPMDVDAIDEPLLLSVLQQIEKRGAIETAHRVRQRCERVFKAAKSLGMTRNNPASDLGEFLQPFSKARRWPALIDLPDVRELTKTLDSAAASPVTKLASRFLSLTAQRPGMIAAAEWKEIQGVDFDDPLIPAKDPCWVIAAKKMKMDRTKEESAKDHLVPLSAQAVETLRAAWTLSATSPYIFPSGRSVFEPMSSNALNVFYKREGFQGRHVPHGWRSSFSTIMNLHYERLLTGNDRILIERLIIDLMLAHIPPGLSANELDYNRGAYLERRREIAQEWADLLLDGAAPAMAMLEGRRRRLD
jgi:integrase